MCNPFCLFVSAVRLSSADKVSQRHKINNLINLIASSEFCRQLSSCKSPCHPVEPPPPLFLSRSTDCAFLAVSLSPFELPAAAAAAATLFASRFSQCMMYHPGGKKTQSNVNFSTCRMDTHCLTSTIHLTFLFVGGEFCLFANISSLLTLMTMTLRLLFDSFSSFASRFVFSAFFCCKMPIYF